MGRRSCDSIHNTPHYFTTDVTSPPSFFFLTKASKPLLVSLHCRSRRGTCVRPELRPNASCVNNASHPKRSSWPLSAAPAPLTPTCNLIRNTEGSRRSVVISSGRSAMASAIKVRRHRKELPDFLRFPPGRKYSSQDSPRPRHAHYRCRVYIYVGRPTLYYSTGHTTLPTAESEILTSVPAPSIRRPRFLLTAPPPPPLVADSCSADTTTHLYVLFLRAFPFPYTAHECLIPIFIGIGCLVNAAPAIVFVFRPEGALGAAHRFRVYFFHLSDCGVCFHSLNGFLLRLRNLVCGMRNTRAFT